MNFNDEQLMAMGKMVANLFTILEKGEEMRTEMGGNAESMSLGTSVLFTFKPTSKDYVLTLAEPEEEDEVMRNGDPDKPGIVVELK